MSSPPSTLASKADPPRRGVVAVVARSERLLVIRRSQFVVAPGAICFPGGALEGDESEPAALVRELREELSVDVSPVRRIWQSVTPWGVSLAWWQAALDPRFEPVACPREVADHYWLRPGELDELPELLESNRHFLAAWRSGEFAVEGLLRDGHTPAP